MADAFMKYMGGDGSVQSVVTKYALRVFYLLAGIQFVWSFVNLALSSDLTFQGIVANLVRQGFTLTFFYWLVKNVAQYGGYLRQYLGMIANEAVGLSSLSDATVQKIVGYSSSQYGSVPDIGELYILTLECCHNLISSAAKNAGWGMGYIYALGVMFISIPILWTISKIILKIFLVYLQTYFALALSMLVMGLSALDATRRHAIESISKVVSVLLKYFAIQLILGVVVALLVEWTALTEGLNGLNALLVSLALMGGVSIFSGLVDELPEFISGFMGPGGIGSSVSGMFSGVTGPIHTARTIKQDVNTAAAPLVAGLSATQNALWGHNLFAPVGGGNAFGGNRNRSSVFDNLRAAGFNKAGNAVESLYNRGALGSLGVGAYKAYKTYKNSHGEEASPPSGGAGQASSTDPASGTAERNKPAKAGSGKTP